jgi:hypothetical protein
MPRERYVSIATFLVRSGTSTVVTAPPQTEWSLLFAHRIPMPDSSFAGSTTLTAMVLTQDGHLADRAELLTFGPHQGNPLMPGLDLDSSSPVVCALEGPGVLRLLFASKSRARLSVRRFDAQPAPAFAAPLPGAVAEMAAALAAEMPAPFFESPEIEKFDARLIDRIARALAAFRAGEILPHFLDVVRGVDQELTLGKRLTDGFAVFFVTFLNTFVGLFETLVAICLQKQNFLSFQYLLLFVSNRSVANSVLGRPLPRLPVRDPGALYLLFGYVAEHRPAVHYHLLNLFATVSPMEELRIVFALAPITGIPGGQAPKEALAPSAVHAFERRRAGVPGREARAAPVLGIGALTAVSSGDRPPHKFSPFVSPSVSIAPSPGRQLSKVNTDVVEIARGGWTHTPTISTRDIGIATVSVVMTVVSIFAVFYFFAFA